MIMTCSWLPKAADRSNIFDVQLLHTTLTSYSSLAGNVLQKQLGAVNTPMWQCCPCEENVKFSFFILKSCLCCSADIQRCEESRKSAQKVTSV